MMISASSIQVFDSSLPEGTPIAYEIIGGNPPRATRGLVAANASETKLHLDAGVYEVRLFHPTIGPLSKVLDVTDSPRGVMFADMRRTRSGKSWARDAEPKAAVASGPARGDAWHGLRRSVLRDDGAGAEASDGRAASAARLDTSLWCADRAGAWKPLADQAPELHLDEPALYSVAPSADVLRVSEADRAIAVRLPPMTTRIELTRNRQGRLSIRPRIANARAEMMLDYLMSGYVREADSVRGSADACELLDREHQSPAGAFIGAYYLLRTGEAAEYAEWFRELARNFPGFPDASIALAQVLLRVGGEDPGARAEARHALLHAVREGLPFYREGVRLAREGLDWIAAGANFEDGDVNTAIEALRPYQRAMLHDGAVTCWECGPTPAPLLPPPRARAMAAHA